MEPEAEIRGEMDGCFDFAVLGLALLAGSFIAGVLAMGLWWTVAITLIAGVLLTIALGVGAVLYAIRNEMFVSEAAGEEDPVDEHAATAVTEDRSVSDMIQDALDTDTPSEAEAECVRRNRLDLSDAERLELDVRFAAATALFHGPVPYIPAQPDIAEEA